MTNENTPYNVETDEDFTPTAKADENNLVYDTIRDITLSFEFTSKANSEASYENIVWKVDKEMNDSRKFIDSFNIDYGEEDPLGETSIKKDVLSIINPAKDTSSIDEDLLELMKKL